MGELGVHVFTHAKRRRTINASSARSDGALITFASPSSGSAVTHRLHRPLNLAEIVAQMLLGVLNFVDRSDQVTCAAVQEANPGTLSSLKDMVDPRPISIG